MSERRSWITGRRGLRRRPCGKRVLRPGLVSAAVPALARALALALGLALVVGAGSFAGRAGAAEPDASTKPPSTWHATTVVSGRMGHRIIDYWSKGASLRAETLISGHPIVTLVRGDRYVVMDRLTGEGLDIGRAPRAIAEDRGRSRPFGNELEEIRAAGGEKVDEARQSGVATEVWRVTDAQTRRTLWVTTREPRVPVRVEMFVRGGGETITTDYANWGFDLEIPDRFFQPPEGATLERLDYETWVTRSREGQLGELPVLYPDLLHGSPGS